MGRLQTGTSSPRTFWSEPISRFGSFDFTRFAGVHHVTHSVFPLARYPGAAPRHRYFSACFTPLRYQRRMTPMRRGRQDRLGSCDHSLLTTSRRTWRQSAPLGCSARMTPPSLGMVVRSHLNLVFLCLLPHSCAPREAPWGKRSTAPVRPRRLPIHHTASPSGCDA
jgi:hypothetical protein